jgi:serine/threonine-protein kinase RsbT
MEQVYPQPLDAIAGKTVDSKRDSGLRVPIASDHDLVTARQGGRELAVGLGFSGGEATLVATAISELARNIVQYARCGEIFIHPAFNGEAAGITIIARDQGPGIPSTGLAMQGGYFGSRVLGLAGVRRVMDEFVINSLPASGTTVTATKWKRQ